MTRKAQMIEMREKGMNYTDIGKKFGISKQRVYQLIGGDCKKHFQGIKAESCVYKGICQYLIANQMSVAEFTRKIYGGNHSVYHSNISKVLKGQVDVKKSIIDRILDITGLTYEQAFKRSDNNGE